MRFENWLQFKWDLSTSTGAEVPPAPFHIEQVAKADLDVVIELVGRSLLLDPDWGNTLHAYRSQILALIERAFQIPIPLGVLLFHGKRAIGLSILDPNVASVNHLVTGPCILSEYRNRGLGSALLACSLELLRELDFPHACGVTRDKTVAGRHVYPKFHGVASPISILDVIKMP